MAIKNKNKMISNLKVLSIHAQVLRLMILKKIKKVNKMNLEESKRNGRYLKMNVKQNNISKMT